MSSAVLDRPEQAVPASRPTPRERLRALVSPPRITALDAARALAILGMVGAHVGNIPPFELGNPFSWLVVVHGNSALLFAVLAGISIALLTGRQRIPEVEELPRLRAGLLGRALVIFLIGLVLEMLGTSISVILTFYGVMYVLALPVLRWRPGRLLLLALPIALVGPLLSAAVEVFSLGGYGAGTSLVVTGVYGVTTWTPLMLLGMALGRLPLERKRVAAALAGIGAVLAIGATVLGSALFFLVMLFFPDYGGVVYNQSSSYSADFGESGSWVSTEYDPGTVPADSIDFTDMVCYPPMPGDPTVFCEPADYWTTGAWGTESSDDLTYVEVDAETGEILAVDSAGGADVQGWESYGDMLWEMDPAWRLGDSVISLEPHSGSTLEIFRSGGIALLVIGVLLLVARPLRWVLLPLSALGSMPLTAYSLHIVSVFLLAGPGGWIVDNRVWAVTAVALLLACTLWAALRGRGPLEELTARVSRRIARTVPAPAAGTAPDVGQTTVDAASTTAHIGAAPAPQPPRTDQPGATTPATRAWAATTWTPSTASPSTPSQETAPRSGTAPQGGMAPQQGTTPEAGTTPAEGAGTPPQ